MAKNNKQYWAERALKREHESYLMGARLTTKTFTDYQRAARDIRRQINDFYIRYAKENRLTYEEAVRIMSRREMQEWKAGLGAYVERINAQTDPVRKAKLKAELDALSYNSRISRLQALEAEINMKLNELFDRGVRQMKDEFGAILEEAYYKKVFDIQQRVGYQFEFARLDKDMIENIISYPWSGADFPSRMWKNKDALLFNTREILTQGLIQGKSLSVMSKELADNMGQSFKNAERLIRTETTHFHSEADKKAYEAANIKKYEYMATLDNRTSDICASLDGEVFDISKAEVGVNYPPMHPNCRSTTIEYDPEDAQDWAESGLEMPENKKYKDWYNEEVANKGEDKFKQEQKRDRNVGQDQKQYERYKDVLGKDAPKTFAAFQEMKYNDSSTWDNLKKYYAGRNGGNIPKTLSFKQFKDNVSGNNWKAVDFSPKGIERHFSKHAKDYGNISEQEYVNMAKELMNAQISKNIKGFVSEDGWVFRYNEITNDFATAKPNGVIETLFKPKKGKIYWERQIKKYGGS